MRIKNFVSRVQNSNLFFSVLFAICFITRLPTLFNDFYDVDELSVIVQTKEWLAGYTPGVDFAESKRWLFHQIFKLTYSIFPDYGWVFIHLITICIIFLTAVCIYHIGRIVRGQKEGMVAAVLYGVLISSFNRHFMATNGEVVFNLPVTAGALFFLCALSSVGVRRIILSLLSILCVIGAVEIKLHGLIIAVFIIFFLFLYLPWYKGLIKKMIIPYILIGIAIVVVLALIFLKKNTLLVSTLQDAQRMINYAVYGRSTNPFFLIVIFVYRQVMLVLWHFIVWVPAIYMIYYFIKNKFSLKTMEESAVMILFLLTYIMVFAGGARMYYHYFMACYPALCLIASFALFSVKVPFMQKLRMRITMLILVPGIFFFTWNIKDDIIRNFAPDCFYNEGSFLFWTRSILLSTANDYLLPNKSYKATVDYIKSHTSPEDKIFVWGDGPNIYYFADRRIAIYHVWPKNSVVRMTALFAENTPQSIAEAGKIESGFIRMIDSRKAELIIDTSPKGLHVGVTRLGAFAKYPYPIPPMMRKYINEKYTLETKIDGYTLYRRKK